MVKKIISLLAVFILLTGLLAGCGKKENQQPSAQAGKTPVSRSTDSPATGTDQSKAEKSGSGIYNGEIDSNSVEIKFNGEDTAFRLSDNVKGLFEGDTFKSKDPVSFKYFVDQYGRLVITEITKTK